MSNSPGGWNFGWPVAVTIVAIVGGTIVLATMNKLPSEMFGVVKWSNSTSPPSPSSSENKSPSSTEANKNPTANFSVPAQKTSNPSTSLEQKDIEPIFNSFIDTWNSGQYKRQISFLSKDFTSISYDKSTGQSYENYSYSEYEELKNKLSKIYQWIRVTPLNVEFIPDKNGAASIKYDQHYNSPKYESWGVEELYFRRNDKNVEIFKEVFYRDRFIKK